ncbi:sulfur carrier protein ThiS [Nocardia jinanensis]|uniref:Thiamine biosynthesis protein ThiS n=1 Tax=Nocardia jinanensis TaxID=382504 RepID=A0A917VVY5_9NOCA|nr:sulfur carrier protein ThiS [Nocardia jinanensis]GGL27765.1 putative thiamine biosynthesis protein ThiS [Nocardia jinanensis]
MTQSPTQGSPAHGSSVPIGVTVNGVDHEFAEPLTVRELLERLELPCQGVALAVDGTVFPKSRWEEPVGRGWEIDVLTAVQGG